MGGQGNDDNDHREHSIGNQSDCHARGWEPVNSGKDYGLIFRDGLVTQMKNGDFNLKDEISKK